MIRAKSTWRSNENTARRPMCPPKTSFIRHVHFVKSGIYVVSSNRQFHGGMGVYMYVPDVCMYIYVSEDSYLRVVPMMKDTIQFWISRWKRGLDRTSKCATGLKRNDWSAFVCPVWIQFYGRQSQQPQRLLPVLLAELSGEEFVFLRRGTSGISYSTSNQQATLVVFVTFVQHVLQQQ
jgi:hypothetical protein